MWMRVCAGVFLCWLISQILTVVLILVIHHCPSSSSSPYSSNFKLQFTFSISVLSFRCFHHPPRPHPLEATAAHGTPSDCADHPCSLGAAEVPRSSWRSSWSSATTTRAPCHVGSAPEKPREQPEVALGGVEVPGLAPAWRMVVNCRSEALARCVVSQRVCLVLSDVCCGRTFETKLLLMLVGLSVHCFLF